MKHRLKFFLKLTVVVILVFSYLLFPPFKHSINKVSFMLSSLNIKEVKDYINSFGIWSPLVSIILMMFQSIAAPLPAFVITFANAYLYGWAFGTLISWTGAMLGAMLCFYLSRIYGRPTTEKFINKKALDKTDLFFKKYGEYAVLIARLLPFVSFDAISYAAGLTNMSIISFLIATGIGQLPATIVYSILGQNIGKTTKFGLFVVTGFLSLIVFALAVKKYFDDKRKGECNA